MTFAYKKDAAHLLSMRVRIVENLGKELLVYGVVGDNEVRISYTDKSQYQVLKDLVKEKGQVYLNLGEKYNVFEMPSGRNCVIF